MQVIKPYGRTHVEVFAGTTKRVLAPRSDPDARVDIESFAQSHAQLVIAQWISTIDKIARKPRGKTGPTHEQREFRQRLGDAAWARVERLVARTSDASTDDYFLNLWNAKIAPYGAVQHRPRPGPTPSPKGRWYERFAGGASDVAHADVNAIAERIELHLRGHISKRARSIAKNVLEPKLPAYSGGLGSGWTAEDCSAYAAAGDVAAQIRRAAEMRENGQDQAGSRRVTIDVAAAVLFSQFARIFRGPDSQTLTIDGARALLPGLLNLHMAIKDTYTRVLKNQRKDERAHGRARRKVSPLLPDTMHQLFALVDAKRTNRDLNSLVRLGRIIHYEASDGGDDRPRNVVDCWPGEIGHSRFWTSDGQAEIKRSEAFVRVWRQVLGLASQTLTDWADARRTIGGDILLSAAIDRATGAEFDADSQSQKLDLLFGKRAALLKPEDGKLQRALLRLALQGVARLRHSAFHFKGLGTFASALSACADDADPRTMEALRQLWAIDAHDRAARIMDIARGARFDYFYDETACGALMDAVWGAGLDPITLPRFSRMLLRAENAWSRGEADLGLPKLSSRSEMQDPATRCQYETLKLLYERPFRDWFYNCGTDVLNEFIDRAVSRATAAARDLNAGGDRGRRDVIVARAARIGRLTEGAGIDRFFFKLSAETASEMRVQRGYESDPERAREHGKYIEDLKLDVVALAFAAYLKQAGFAFALALRRGTARPEAPLARLPDPPRNDAPRLPEDWAIALYFLSHLVPVEEIGRLLHQIRKWDNLAGPSPSAVAGKARKAQSVLELYLDMHDAKIDGGSGLSGANPFRMLFERPEDFNRIFPSQEPLGDDELLVARRGLRQIIRFGHLPSLRAIFEKNLISASEVSTYLSAEAPGTDGKSLVSRLHEEREILHGAWVKEQRGFSGGQRARYQTVLDGVIQYRHLAGRVTLTDHVRLHRLLMAVLGRLVDYSGLWERDLYFATLGLIHQAGKSPATVFNSAGVKLFENGQIIWALQRGQPSSSLIDGLNPHFGGVWKNASRAVKIRNKLAHFDMLRSGDPVDLTLWVNQTRELMAHDRKLRNAISQSVKELLRRENLDLAWIVDPTSGHQLGPATIATRQAFHLGGRSIAEDLHGEGYLQMAAALFGRCEVKSPLARESIRRS